MRAARSAETTRIRVDPGKLELPVHLHVENSRDLRGQGNNRLRRACHADHSCSVRLALRPRGPGGKGAPPLRWVHAHGAGINHLMPLDWLPRGAVLTNSRGVHGEKADEYALMAILMLNNRLPRIMNNQSRARWEQPFSSSLAGKTLLVVGVGHGERLLTTS